MHEKNLTEHESLKLITEMIHQAKGTINENGTSCILWGSAVGVSGLVNFAELQWHFYIGFDIWLLTLAAFIPQIFISIRESRQRKVLTHTESTLNVIWLVYTISIISLIFYLNIVPHVSDQMASAEGTKILLTHADGKTVPFHYFPLSGGSLLLLVYAIPTLATGLITKFRPMIYGAILCYILFFISCYTNSAYDMLWNGLAGICNWFIPGLILRRKYSRKKKAVNV
jgi:hypothetical protein